MEKFPIAVLISGNGTNLQALIDACKEPGYPAEIVKVISNKAEAFGLERAKRVGIPTHILPPARHFSSRETFDDEVSGVLEEVAPKLVCLAGYMRLLSPGFVRRWHNRLINIHPSLLPSFKGLNAQAQALEAGVKWSGCTVHFVREAMDDGPIIVQGVVPVYPNDTVESLGKSILTVEHQCYPLAVKLIAEQKLVIDEDDIRYKEAVFPRVAGIVNPAG